MCIRDRGTVFQVPWTFLGEKGSWPGEGMALLKKMGFQTAAMALKEDSVSIEDTRIRGADRLAVILGTEGDEMCIRDRCREALRYLKGRWKKPDRRR